MLNLSRALCDVLDLGDVSYPLDLSFDNVLRLLELWYDPDVHPYIKGFVALEMLTGENLSERLTLDESFKVYELIFNEHIANIDRADGTQYDLEGNPLPDKQKGTKSENKPLYSLVYDADYIYASFMQAYGIDLIEQQGVLHWKKFNALIVGLPDSTKLVQVMKIRAWKPTKGDSAQYKEQMRKLQRELSLPEDSLY